MVTSSVGNNAPRVEFVLRPNRSLNWKAACAAFSVFVGFTVVIAIYFASQGAWLVLPFAGAELLVLGIGLYACSLRTHTQEVVRIETDSIRIQRGRRRPSSEIHLPRAWARVVLISDTRHWYPSRLLIRSHGKSVEVGSHLVESERLHLADQLGCLLRPGAVWPNTLSNHRPLPVAIQGPLPTETATG
ncbi:MAG: hypothetical protein Kow006_14400 [Gammaproteobacteria bacterium]